MRIKRVKLKEKGKIHRVVEALAWTSESKTFSEMLARNPHVLFWQPCPGN